MSGKILIVDDERSIRTAVRDTLSREGYLAVASANAEEAMRRCRSESFDVMITDLKMPDVSGIELIRQVRALLPSIKTVVMTAYASADSAIEALRLGVSDYMIKPFRLSELRYTISRLVQETREALEPTPEQREFTYRFGSENNMLNIYGKAAGSEGDIAAAADAIRLAARALSAYAEQTGATIDAAAAAEAISDMLYFERRLPVNLRCESNSPTGCTRAVIGKETQNGTQPPAGGFPGLRARTEDIPADQPLTTTGVFGDSKVVFLGENLATQTMTMESDNVDLGALVHHVEKTARIAGFNSVDTNDVVAAVNEAVLNSVEHGYGRNATGKVDVTCDIFKDELIATIKDYGGGFDVEAVGEGGGFSSFRKLVDRVAIESKPGAGTTVYLAKAAK